VDGTLADPVYLSAGIRQAERPINSTRRWSGEGEAWHSNAGGGRWSGETHQHHCTHPGAAAASQSTLW